MILEVAIDDVSMTPLTSLSGMVTNLTSASASSSSGFDVKSPNEIKMTEEVAALKQVKDEQPQILFTTSKVVKVRCPRCHIFYGVFVVIVVIFGTTVVAAVCLFVCPNNIP